MTNDALRTILPIAGWSRRPRPRGRDHRRRRSDPADAVPHRARPAPRRSPPSGLAVSDLWELRTGRRQEIAIDARQATASLRSGHYLKMDGDERVDRAQRGHGHRTRRRTAAGATSTATSRTIAPPRSTCSACPRIATRCAKPWRSGTRSSSRRRSSPPRAPAAWCARWTSGRSIRRPRRSRRCR